MEQQRLRWGFPPKELRPSADPTHPVELTNGERVSVDVVAGAERGGKKREGGSTEGRGAEGEREEGDDDNIRRKEQDFESARKGKKRIIQWNLP